jgi:hypothetical protein
VQSTTSKLATAIYLASLGRDKVGFSHEDARPGAPPGFVKGLRGMGERNIMRYYLGLEPFLDTETVPSPHRWEARINAAYDLMERSPSSFTIWRGRSISTPSGGSMRTRSAFNRG